MLSSHCDDGGMLPYYARGGQQPAADHHRRYSRPNKNVVEVAPSCPRCDSPNTKFCYYNNYSLSQPRYFCKGCRRYWTKGGSLRNVPVGGGCRKNRRGKSSAALSVATAAAAAVGTVGGGAAFSHHRFPAGTVRPDLLLEGMVLGDPGGGLGQHQQQPASADNNKPAAADDGSAIDLALLYAKFLNRHQPAAVEQCAAVVPELADTESGSGSGSSDMGRRAVVAPPDQPFSSHDHGGGSGTLSVPASTEPGATAPQRPDSRVVEELSFSVDQSCYEYDSLVVGLQTDDDGGGDLILQSTWYREAKYEPPFDPLLPPEEDAASLHDSVAGADDVWSSALACHGGLEAALCSRP